MVFAQEYTEIYRNRSDEKGRVTEDDLYPVPGSKHRNTGHVACIIHRRSSGRDCSRPKVEINRMAARSRDYANQRLYRV